MEVEEPDDPDELPLSKRCHVFREKVVDDIVKVDKSSHSPSERARAEVRRYTEEEPSADNPLEWWKKNHTRFPYLSVLARNTWPYQQRLFLKNEYLVSIAGHIIKIMSTARKRL